MWLEWRGRGGEWSHLAQSEKLCHRGSVSSGRSLVSNVRESGSCWVDLDTVEERDLILFLKGQLLSIQWNAILP